MELGARGAGSHKGEVLSRRDAGPAAEQAVEMKFRQAHGLGDGGEARLGAKVRVDEADGARNAGEITAVYKSISVRRVHVSMLAHALCRRDPVLALAAVAGQSHAFRP